jgi:hypothetical protein
MFDLDSDVMVGTLLGFLSCKPGDVEEDYFSTYTERQLAFANEHGEELAIWSSDLEEGGAN